MAHYALHWRFLAGLSAATISGLVLAGAAFLVLDLIFKQTQAGSEFAVEDMVGREAEVITPIPEAGAGEVAYVVKGQRETAPARSLDGTPIAKGRVVLIETVTGNTLHVRVKA